MSDRDELVALVVSCLATWEGPNRIADRILAAGFVRQRADSIEACVLAGAEVRVFHRTGPEVGVVRNLGNTDGPLVVVCPSDADTARSDHEDQTEIHGVGCCGREEGCTRPGCTGSATSAVLALLLEAERLGVGEKMPPEAWVTVSAVRSVLGMGDSGA